jgi:hypothetical protein
MFAKVVFHKHQDGGSFGDIWRGTTINGDVPCVVKIVKQTGRWDTEAEGQHEYDILQRVKGNNRPHPHFVEGLELITSPQTGMFARLGQ